MERAVRRVRDGDVMHFRIALDRLAPKALRNEIGLQRRQFPSPFMRGKKPMRGDPPDPAPLKPPMVEKLRHGPIARGRHTEMAINEGEPRDRAFNPKKIGKPVTFSPIGVQIWKVGVTPVGQDFALGALAEVGIEVVGIELRQIGDDRLLARRGPLDAQHRRQIRACRHPPIML
jgi:hypothetical protein